MLTDTQIRRSKPGSKSIKLTDSHGLYIEVRPTGSKLWRYRYRIDGKENVFAMGEYPELGLADAREKRIAARKLVKQGVHPAHARSAEKAVLSANNANTFAAVAGEWVEKKQVGWSTHYYTQVSQILKLDVYPYIGKLPVGSTTSHQILLVLQRIEERGAASVALLTRQICSAVFCYAISTLRAQADPTVALKGAITKPKTRHSKAMSREELRKLVSEVESYSGFDTTKTAIKLIMLLFVRTVELRKAEWSEFDLDAAVWRIPASRMKAGDRHTVPLSRQAVALIRELRDLTVNRQYLFPNYRRPRECMNSQTITRALERMGFNRQKEGEQGFTAHGFRATASTMLNEMGYRPDVIERQLAHKERNSTRASYNQAEYLEERTAMMQQWADYIDSIVAGGSVVPLKKAE
ncbi:MAG: tyrosine-type recombinase/integrase [Gammaproteobacteria bacterium]|nr:tyrosine-type recombinase/integrase [Gammaproteobacteria bacterium]